MSADFSPGETTLAAADRAGEEAAAWLARRDRGLDAKETRQLAEWLEADARHAAEFARIEAVWNRCDAGQFDAGLAAMAQAVQTRALARRRRRRLWWGGLVAAAAAVALVFALRHVRQPAPAPVLAAAASPTYRVVPSSSRELTLADGSVVRLRGDSRIRTEFTASARHVWLLQGEAHFMVAKDPSRPFTVRLGAVAVRAVGTAFNLQLNPAAVEVLVVEGKVQVEDSAHGHSLLAAATNPGQVLTAGHRAFVNTESGSASAADVEAVAAAEIEQTLVWETVQLVFDRTPLREAIEAFNRYSPHRLVLGAAELGDRTLGGTCRANNADGFVRLLEKMADVRAERRGPSEIILWPKR